MNSQKSWAFAAMLAAGLALSGCGGGGKKPAEGYRTQAVDRGPITLSISATGTLEALVTVQIGSQLSGQITAIPVDFNQRVKVGQLLAKLDPASFEARVRQARADLLARKAGVESAQASLLKAEADFRRSQALVSTGFVSDAGLDQVLAARDQANAALSVAKAQLTQAQAALASAETDLGRTEIRSPISGVVVGRFIDVGQTVAASFQAPVLFTIAQDLSKMRVELKVDEADIGQVREGASARFTVDAFPDRTFEAAVEQVRISPETAQNVVTYVVTLVTDNPERRLLPGMTANAEIIVDERADVLRAPAQSIRFVPADKKIAAKAEGLNKPAAPGPGQTAPPNAAPNGAANGQRPNAGPGGRGPGGALVQALALDSAQQTQLRTLMQQAFQGAAEGGDRRKAFEGALRKLEPSLRPDQKEKLAAFRAERAKEAAGGARPAIVWRLAKGKVPEPLAVQVGLADSTGIELLGGEVKEGDLLIISGPPAKGAPAAGAQRPPGGFGAR